MSSVTGVLKRKVKCETLKEVLGRTDRLLSFDHNLSILYDKNKNTLFCMLTEVNKKYHLISYIVGIINGRDL
jgi:hypothetical protein